MSRKQGSSTGGNPTDPTRPILATGNDRRVEIDLDVLGKRALAGITGTTDGDGKPVIRYQSDPRFLGSDIVRYTLRNPTTNGTFEGSIGVEVLGGNVEQDPALVAILENQAQVTVGNEAPEKQLAPRQSPWVVFSFRVTTQRQLVWPVRRFFRRASGKEFTRCLKARQISQNFPLGIKMH